MFDVAFSELIVIAVVALVVIGPERLPKVARTLGALTGRMQRYVAQVKDEVNREVRFQELQQLQQEIKATVAATQAKFTTIENDVVQQADEISSAIQSATSPSTTPPINTPESSMPQISTSQNSENVPEEKR